jgi:hypothetical protein
MPENTVNDILVALARLETKVDNLRQQFQKVEVDVERQWKKLADHDVELEKLRSAQPKTPIATWLLVSVAVLGFIAAFVQYVVK